MSVKKKVAFIGVKSIPGVGGTARVVENIISYLKRDYDITIYTNGLYANKELFPYDCKQIIIKKSKINKINIYKYYFFAFMHILLFSKYHIIHLQGADSAVFLPLLKIKYKNIISTSHARGQFRVDKFAFLEQLFLKISEHFFLKDSKIVTCVSKTIADEYSMISNRKIYYIPNGINLEESIDLEAASKRLKKYGINNDNFVFFASNRIIPSKGCHILLEALNHIHFDYHLGFAGDLDQIAKYKNKILKMLPPINASYIGFVSEKSELLGILKKAKLFIFPSTYEAMSMMLLEAAWAKIPIICSDIPQNTSIFSTEEILFFKNGDYIDLAKKIDWAFSNWDLMINKSEKAFIKLTENYTWSNISNKYKCLYEKLDTRFS